MKLSEKIRILRKARGLSQEQFGYALSEATDGVSRQTVSDWENGKFEPKLDNIRDIAKVLDVSFDVLLDESIDLNDPETLTQALYAHAQGPEIASKSSESYYIRAYDVQCGAIIGEINSYELILYSCHSLGNVLRLPIDKIKDIQLEEGATKAFGKLRILLCDSEKPITSVNVELPQEAIDFYRNVVKNR